MFCKVLKRRVENGFVTKYFEGGRLRLPVTCCRLRVHFSVLTLPNPEVSGGAEKWFLINSTLLLSPTLLHHKITTSLRHSFAIYRLQSINYELIYYFCPMKLHDNIVALATPSGAGAIAIIRVSGPDAIKLVAPIFKAKSKKGLLEQPSHTLHLGNIVDGERILDEVLVSIFHGPKSYTGENTIEVSCHGSPYIQQEIIQLLIRKG
ncbi:MAG: hypothetical protein WBL27_11050, partial [Salinimicrobium sp.]